MTYLFDRAIGAALVKGSPKTSDVDHLKGACEKASKSLAIKSRRGIDRPDDYSTAEALVLSMGEQFRPKQGPWAGTYVEEWRMVSSNAGIIRDLVSAELETAYELGIDIRDEGAIGKMFDLAVQVWSLLGEYSSAPQDGGRR